MVRMSLFPAFLAATSVSAAITRSSHTRWRNKLLPLSLGIVFRTVQLRTRITVLREAKKIPTLRTRMIVATVGLVCSDQLS